MLHGDPQDGFLKIPVVGANRYPTHYSAANAIGPRRNGFRRRLAHTMSTRGFRR